MCVGSLCVNKCMSVREVFLSMVIWGVLSMCVGEVFFVCVLERFLSMCVGEVFLSICVGVGFLIS